MLTGLIVGSAISIFLNYFINVYYFKYGHGMRAFIRAVVIAVGYVVLVLVISGLNRA